MKYSIEFSERKTTSTGKQKIDASLKDMAGETHDKVSIWADFPGFSGLMTGHFVEGDIVTKQNGQNVYKNLYPPRAQKVWNAPGGTKPSGAVEAAKITKASVGEAQENKELGIKTSSTIRMAMDIVIARMSTENERIPMEDIKEAVQEWRKWLWNNWEYKVTDMEEPF